MSIIQTNLPTFVEQPERSIIRQNASLDRLTVKLIGPMSKASKNIPAYGSPATKYGYPLMLCKSVQVTDKDGSLCTIEVTYIGRIDATANQNFTSETLVSTNLQEGELTYQEFFATLAVVIVQATPDGQTKGLTQWKCGTNSFVRRYGALSSQIRYVTNFKPSGPSFSGGGLEWSFDRYAGQGSSTYITVTGSQAPNASQANIPGPFGISSGTYLTGFDVQQIIGPWYEVSETWTFKFIPPGA